MSRMNAGIILSGQQPDLVNTLVRSTQAATLANANQRQNQLAQTFQQHGSGILAGDQTALNALAQVDPRQALQVQQFNQQQANADRRFEFDERKFDFQVQQFMASANAEQKAAAAEEARHDAFRLGAAQSPEEFDSIALEIGEEHLVGGFDEREKITRKYMTSAELLDASKPQSGPGKVQADINAGNLPPDTPLRTPSTVINTGDIQRSAEAGVVDPEAVQPSDAFQGDISGAVGTEGFVTGAINSIGEAIQLGQASPNVDQAQTALTSLSTKTMLGLSAEFPGRPSNLTRERIEELTVKPGSIWTGPERALNKTRDMIETLDDSIRAANAVLLDPIYSKQDKAQAKTALRQLTTLFADYKALEQSLVAPQTQDGKNTTQSGVSWEVVE